MAESLPRLEKTAFIEITEKEASELGGQPLGGTGGRVVLLRGLAWDIPHANFTLTWLKGKVRVNNRCLGKHSLPIVRRAIVARLPDLPSEVYVDLGMAQ